MKLFRSYWKDKQFVVFRYAPEMSGSVKWELSGSLGELVSENLSSEALRFLDALEAEMKHADEADSAVRELKQEAGIK